MILRALGVLGELRRKSAIARAESAVVKKGFCRKSKSASQILWIIEKSQAARELGWMRCIVPCDAHEIGV